MPIDDRDNVVKSFLSRHPRSARLLALALLAIAGGAATGCAEPSPSVAQSAPQERGGDRPVAVETQVVRLGSVRATLDYTGTTRPARTVALRSQVEGQVLELTADEGDPVAAGQLLARLDRNVLSGTEDEARAELGARRSEVVQAQAEVSEARAAVEQARLQAVQARTDADRLRQLADAGAVPDRDAEQAQLVLDTAEQAVRAAQDRVRVRQQAVAAAQDRVAAQQAVLDRARAQLAFTELRSPISGLVLARLADPGDLAQPGTELLQLGDLSELEVTVDLSELDLNRVRSGQGATVRLDAFPDRTLVGRVTRIAPVADPNSRLLPVTVTVPNPDGRIGSGLLARVQFDAGGGQYPVVPEGAVRGNPPVAFVLRGAGSDAPDVAARPVTLGDRANGQVEVRSGLSPGESVVVRSDRPLADGQPVRSSILSDPPVE